MVTEINSSVFDEKIKGKCIVDFYTSNCPNCDMLKPIFEKVAGKCEGVNFFKVNLNDNMQLASRFDIDHVPVLTLFENGEQIKSFAGCMPETKLMDFITN